MFGNGSSPYPQVTHHIWYVNNEVEGFGQSGIQTFQGEYLFAVNNTISNQTNEVRSITLNATATTTANNTNSGSNRRQ